MKALIKYTRVFWKTLVMLVRGQSVPESANMPYRRWSERNVALVTAFFAVADKSGMTQDKRESLKLKIDGREVSLQLILKTIAYHSREEYAYLLKNLTENSITTIVATNINDEYALSRFIDAKLIENEEVIGALITIHKHIGQIPYKT
jgi:hypothetical protein